ncbi:YaiI/YqxD family protein [bacterium]|nr:YaiI/YqxD family protein [bacterium]
MANNISLPTRIIVDADACPVKELIERAAARHGVKVLMVTATAMRDRGAGIEVVRIPSGPDAVDDWIVEHCEAGDIIVTQDIPLAAAAIARGARVIENRGEIFDPSNIGVRLAMRDLTMGLRDAGVLDPMTSGPRPLAQRDRHRFAQALGKLLDETRRNSD